MDAVLIGGEQNGRTIIACPDDMVTITAEDHKSGVYETYHRSITNEQKEDRAVFYYHSRSLVLRWR